VFFDKINQRLIEVVIGRLNESLTDNFVDPEHIDTSYLNFLGKDKENIELLIRNREADKIEMLYDKTFNNYIEFDLSSYYLTEKTDPLKIFNDSYRYGAKELIKNSNDNTDKDIIRTSLLVDYINKFYLGK
jgi:hypothetical protein